MTILGHISIVRVFFESFISDTTTLMIREDVLRSLTFIDQETLLCFKHETISWIYIYRLRNFLHKAPTFYNGSTDLQICKSIVVLRCSQ